MIIDDSGWHIWPESFFHDVHLGLLKIMLDQIKHLRTYCHNWQPRCVNFDWSGCFLDKDSISGRVVDNAVSADSAQSTRYWRIHWFCLIFYYFSQSYSTWVLAKAFEPSLSSSWEYPSARYLFITSSLRHNKSSLVFYQTWYLLSLNRVFVSLSGRENLWCS